MIYFFSDNPFCFVFISFLGEEIFGNAFIDNEVFYIFGDSIIFKPLADSPFFLQKGQLLQSFFLKNFIGSY
jgi:hypothetical protein